MNSQKTQSVELRANSLCIHFATSAYSALSLGVLNAYPLLDIVR